MQETIWQELEKINIDAFPQDDTVFTDMVRLYPLPKDAVSFYWLGKTVLPALVLLPAYIGNADLEKQKQLAVVFQQFYFAHQVHCNIKAHDSGKKSAFAILSGDLLYALFYERLYKADLMNFSEPLAKTICAVNEGALLRQKFYANGAVSVKEGLLFLEKEYGSLFGAAAGCGAQLAKTNPRLAGIYHNFAFSLGILFGQKAHPVETVQEKQEIRANYYLKQLPTKEEWLTLNYFLSKVLDKKDHPSLFASIPHDMAL